jgi:hypothetical protein
MNELANTLSSRSAPPFAGDDVFSFLFQDDSKPSAPHKLALSGAALALASVLTTLPAGVQANYLGASVQRHVQTIATLHRPQDEVVDGFDFVELSWVNQAVLDYMQAHSFALDDISRICSAVASILGSEPALKATVAVDPEEGWSKLVLRFLTGRPEDELLGLEDEFFLLAMKDSVLSKSLRLPVVIFD